MRTAAGNERSISTIFEFLGYTFDVPSWNEVNFGPIAADSLTVAVS